MWWFAKITCVAATTSVAPCSAYVPGPFTFTVSPIFDTKEKCEEVIRRYVIKEHDKDGNDYSYGCYVDEYKPSNYEPKKLN